MRLTVNRRKFITSSALGALAFSGGLAMPAVSRAASRPVVSHGIQSGDVDAASGIVWARSDRPARLHVEVATSESFKDAQRLPPIDALPDTDFAVKQLLSGLPPDQTIFYRMGFADLTDVNAVGEPLTGRFRSAPADRRPVRFTWSADTAGQGWGINPDDGGMKTYAAMAAHDPDFLLHSGDTVYCDGPIKAEAKTAGGGVWKNLVAEGVEKVAETLAEFRGRWKYNLHDENLRSFNAAIPTFCQWDDHEVIDNWSMAKDLGGDDRYTEKSIGILSARAGRAFHEMMPIRSAPEDPGRVYRKISYGPLLDIFFLDLRSYRGPNGPSLETELTPDSRELEIAELLKFIKTQAIANIVWLTADVHYTAAHYYNPDKAQFQEFEPFWEFVSGPLHAGTFGPNSLDMTFGPELRFIKAPAAGQGQNLPPSAGLQFFGIVDIDDKTEQMTVRLMDRDNHVLYKVTLDPRRA